MRCPRCLGQKRVTGIGWIETDCPKCAGIGSITDSPKYDEPATMIADIPKDEFSFIPKNTDNFKKIPYNDRRKQGRA